MQGESILYWESLLQATEQSRKSQYNPPILATELELEKATQAIRLCTNLHPNLQELLTRVVSYRTKYGYHECGVLSDDGKRVD
jgi:hypothetical protein